MKVAININTKTIVDILPDNATENHKFLQINSYVLLEVENPYLEDGTTFRSLTDVELYPFLKEDWKSQRQTLVNNIEVAYNNVVYQGDEKSQDRMSRALNGMPDGSTIPWKAKDNTTQTLSKTDLKEILYLSGQEQTRIWFENEPQV